MKVRLLAPARTNKVTWQGNQAPEFSGGISHQLMVRNMGWSHLLPEHLQASEAVQEEAPGARAMEKMQTTFQRKHWGIFKS